jgi:hypothetical protein
MASTLVRLSTKVHGKVKEYSEATGVPMSKVVENALDDWLKVVGSVHIDAFRSTTARLAESHEPGKVLDFRLAGVVS